MSDPMPGMDEDSAKPERKGCGCSPLAWFLLLITLVLLAGISLGPIGSFGPRASVCLQQTRQIGLMMFAYSNDHDQNYPDGKSSTEVFQKLIDGGYCTDPTIFYISLPGKTKALPGQKLKPENVCYDVTGGLDSTASDGIPLVFMTGYKINYVPGDSAVPIIKPYPRFGEGTRTWSEWWNGEHAPSPFDGDGIAVAYKSNSAMFLKSQQYSNPATDYSIPNFVPTTFDPQGKIYRQLTPDGTLPP